LAVPVKGAFTPGTTFSVFTCGVGSGSGSVPQPTAKPNKLIANNNPSGLNLILVPISNPTFLSLILLIAELLRLCISAAFFVPALLYRQTRL
jgi:phage-related tail fiber protein